MLPYKEQKTGFVTVLLVVSGKHARSKVSLHLFYNFRVVIAWYLLFEVGVKKLDKYEV